MTRRLRIHKHRRAHRISSWQREAVHNSCCRERNTARERAHWQWGAATESGMSEATVRSIDFPELIDCGAQCLVIEQRQRVCGKASPFDHVTAKMRTAWLWWILLQTERYPSASKTIRTSGDNYGCIPRTRDFDVTDNSRRQASNATRQALQPWHPKGPAWICI